MKDSTETKGVSDQLVGLAADLDFRDIPQRVIHDSKLSILDGLGTALVASDHRKSRQIAEALIRVSPGNVSVWGRKERTSLLAASMINGTFVEGLGYSDIHIAAGLHPTGVVLPALLTLGEDARTDGRELLTAYVIGCEVMVRLGLAAAPGKFHQRGFQPTSIAGVLGASLATGRLMKLSRDGLQNALAIASTLSFGSSLSVRVGAYFGGMDPGRAAESGLLSALIAREGVRGIATDPIEGRFGFLETHAGPRNYDASTITRGLSQRWEISDVFRKRYPTSYVCTYVLDAALRVRKRLERDLARVEEVRFGEKASNLELFCEPERQKRRPGSIYDAETSFYFLVALALSEGSVDIRGLDRFEDGALLRLGDRVNGVVDEESHWIEVEFDDGTVEREVQNSLDPTTEEQTRRKFFENSQPVIGREGANKLEGMVNSLEELKDVGRLAEVMRREVGS